MHRAKPRPTIPRGTKVKTTEDAGSTDWSDPARQHVKWGAVGIVLSHSDSHGRVYQVLHNDETVAWYEPEELIRLQVICGVVINDQGHILPYTCQATMDGCEEWCKENLAAWDRMKELGAKVVQAEITILGE